MLESRERKGICITVAQRHEVEIRPPLIPNGVVAGLPVMKGKGSQGKGGLFHLHPFPCHMRLVDTTRRNSNEKNERAYQKGFSKILQKRISRDVL